MEIRRGVLRAFDAGSYTASVEIAGSLATWLPGLAVSRNIAASHLIPGRRVAIMFFEPSNPDDAVICAVWT